MAFTLEKIETLNQRLIDYFGVDTVSGQAMYRIVFSEDILEKRMTQYSESGLILLPEPEMKLLPKYKQWIDKKYLIETLVVVPPMNEKDLTTKVSYEPLFVFADKNDGYLPPKWEVAEMVIASVLAARGKTSLKRYDDGINTAEDEQLARKKRIDDMMEYFGGDESGLMGASLDSGNASFVPHNYEKSS